MQDEALRQISFADLILLNKTDLVTEENLLAAWQFLKKINPTSVVEPCERGVFDPGILLRLDSYKTHRQEQAMSKISFSVVSLSKGAAQSIVAGTAKVPVRHSDVVSHSFELEGRIDLLKFMHWINVLLRVQTSLYTG